MSAGADKVDWLFGLGPWTWRIGLAALNPVSAVRWYRTLRRRRHLLRPDKPVWTRRRALRYIAGCRWAELTGWRR